jgi:hypothetical protein
MHVDIQSPAPSPVYPGAFQKWLVPLCLMVSLSLTGCVSNVAYHEGLPDSSVTGEKLTSLFETITCDKTYTPTALPKSFSMGFVEFDDQGEMFDPQQLEQILVYIQAHRKNLVLITYINGWQNNASIDGSNEILTDPKALAALNTFDQSPKGDVQKFKQFLALVANTKCVKDAGKHVMGVYLGWRGELFKPEPLHTGFYPSRHNAATRMGDASDMGMALMAIQEAARGRHITRDPVLDTDPITVVMGHSFGGKILEQAISQWITREYAFVMINPHIPVSQQEDIILPRFADLVLLMNPASEAIYARRLTRLLQPFGPAFGTSSQTPSPAFVAVGSETDWANGTAFPLGADWVDATERLSNSYRTYPDNTNQWKYTQNTAPNTPGLNNGKVIVKDAATEKTFSNNSNLPLPKSDAISEALTVFNINLSQSHFGNDASSEQLNNDQKLDVHLENGKDATIQLFAPSSPGETNTTRYWILKVDKAIMDGHPDVWNPNAMSLYARLLRLAAPERFRPATATLGHINSADLDNIILHLRPLSKLR